MQREITVLPISTGESARVCRDIALEALGPESQTLQELEAVSRMKSNEEMYPPIVIEGEEAETICRGLMERLRCLPPERQVCNPERRILRGVGHRALVA